MDQVIWVDEKDHILGEVSRQEAHQKSLLHRTIGIILLNDTGEMLLQKRSLNKDTFPGMYTIAASGHVDKGENYDQAAQREMQEELGINTKLNFIKTVINDHPEHRQMQAFYLLRNNGPFKIQQEEVDEAKFFTLTEVKNMSSKITPTVKIALELLKL